MEDTTFDAKICLSHAGAGNLNSGIDTDVVDKLPDPSRIAGTWVNKDNLAYGQLLLKMFRFYDQEGEVAMDCTIGENLEHFFGFYYAWPNDRFYLVLQKAENCLQEHYMFVSLQKDDQDGLYLITDMTGSIRYTRL
ncbi:hypothetical protein [Methanocella sp. MCL-LM]|uniref:hypothetical protein n=1 Tax=Methanocella sp. MCL-LM TaxID=3412035 RepID=UPI003C71BF7B